MFRADLPASWLTSVLHHIMKGAAVDVANGKSGPGGRPPPHLRDGPRRLPGARIAGVGPGAGGGVAGAPSEPHRIARTRLDTAEIRGKECAMSVAESVTVLLAAPRAFCAGVERAIEIVERAIASRGSPVYVRKQIVHNAHVVADLDWHASHDTDARVGVCGSGASTWCSIAGPLQRADDAAEGDGCIPGPAVGRSRECLVEILRAVVRTAARRGPLLPPTKHSRRRKSRRTSSYSTSLILALCGSVSSRAVA